MWNNRKMAFVAILISTSVAFVLVFTNIAPIAAIPSFKLVAGGLPIKLTGYIFGPIIGGVTGLLSDLLSFALRPTFYHFWYSLAWMLAGIMPGLIGYFMNKKWRPRKDVEAERESKYSIVNFIVAILVLLIIAAGMIILIWTRPDSLFEEQKIIKSKILFLSISLSGVSTMLIALMIFRFVLKPKTFNSILPIITFSALLEICATPLITLGDQAAFITAPNSFLTILSGHMLLSPVKIWGNMVIILIAYSIVSPLIYNKTENGWN